MNRMVMTFLAFVIYPLSLQAMDEASEIASNGIDTAVFDALPVQQSEMDSVTRIFWNAKSIQQKIKENLPDHHRAQFTPGDGCNIKGITKTESSAEVCDLNDDPEKMAKFIYNFSVSCNFGSYQVSVCSREQNKLLNELKVTDPEKLVSDENPFDLDSTM